MEPLAVPLRFRSESGRTGYQLRRGAPECKSETADVEQRDVALAPLDPADVGAMQLARFRKRFLRQALRQPAPPHLIAERRAWIHGGEARLLMILVLHTISSATARHGRGDRGVAETPRIGELG